MRPMINDTPGKPAHPMTDEQYAEYLRMQEELAKQPKPAPDPIQTLSEKVDNIGVQLREVLRLLRGGK